MRQEQPAPTLAKLGSATVSQQSTGSLRVLVAPREVLGLKLAPHALVGSAEPGLRQQGAGDEKAVVPDLQAVGTHRKARQAWGLALTHHI